MNTIIWVIVAIVLLIIVGIAISMRNAAQYQVEGSVETPHKEIVLPVRMDDLDLLIFQHDLIMLSAARDSIGRLYKKYGDLTGLGDRNISIHEDGTITKII